LERRDQIQPQPVPVESVKMVSIIVDGW